jgi:uncharacterized peroxidase-related enzyme
VEAGSVSKQQTEEQMSEQYTLKLEPKTPETADPQAKPLLEGAQKKMGMIPNMYSGMANSPGLLSTYLHGYALFREQSGFSPAEQEVVLLTVSRENECHYCMAAHSTLADNMSKVPPEVTDAIREGREVPDGKLSAVHAFTRAMVRSRGFPHSGDVEAFLSAGYSEKQILEIVLAIAVKTISNYSNHLFDTQVDKPFAGRVWRS